MSDKTEQDPSPDNETTETLQEVLQEPPVAEPPVEAEVVDAEVIENEPDPEPDEIKQRGNGLGLIAVILALAAVTVSGIGLWYGFQYGQSLQANLESVSQALEQASQQQAELQGRIDSTSSAFEAQSQQLQQQQQTLEEQDRKLSRERAQIEQQGIEIQRSLESVYQRVGRSSTAWMAAEAEYLLQVANHRLHLEGDTGTAIRALQAADRRLRDAGDPGWIGVRELIAEEIASIRSVEPLDRVGLSGRLNGLSAQVVQLKMDGTEPLPKVPEAPEEGAPQEAQSAQQERTFDTLLRDSWEGFKSIMVIRHHNKPVSAMLPPDQQYFVQQNLRLKFESARMAMLRGDQALYDTSLQLAAQWLSEFFSDDDASVSALKEQISELQAVSVRPEMPEISGSLIALRARLAQPREGAAEQ